MNSVISYLIPRKVKNYFEYRTVKKEWKKLHKETKRKWKEDYERRKLEIEAEMKFKKKLKKVLGKNILFKKKVTWEFSLSSSVDEGDIAVMNEGNGEIILSYNPLEIYSNINRCHHGQNSFAFSLKTENPKNFVVN
ncbi:hypothetical protein Glove_194g104 [Diversispora epigaea]|uniref:Uncharacterized protein n=1 Tax=Diversispora epigaea TaxID=1348612 RepID=A0A397IR34_9GLOM|nr:hypothetical protein Glove_194g104 [Diversispora epigaea]